MSDTETTTPDAAAIPKPADLTPAGKTTGRARGAGVGETKGGKPQVAVSFELTAPWAKGKRITWYNLLETVKQEEHAIKSLRAAGWRGDDITDLSDLSRADVPEVELDIEHDEYNGKWSARIRWVNPLVRVNALPPSKLAALRDRMRSRAIVTATVPSAPMGAEPPPHTDNDAPPPGFDEPGTATGGGPNEDDIPFGFIETRLDRP